MEIDITSRIEQLLAEFEMAPSAFADGIQIPRAVMSHILSRRNKPSLEVAQKILKKFPQVNSDWLINGLGSMIQLKIFEDLENPDSSISPIINQPAVRHSNINVSAVVEPNTAPVVAPAAAPSEKIITATTQQDSEPDIKTAESNVVTDSQLLNAPTTAFPDFSKKIERIIFFYSDKTFSVHLPE